MNADVIFYLGFAPFRLMLSLRSTICILLLLLTATTSNAQTYYGLCEAPYRAITGKDLRWLRDTLPLRHPKLFFQYPKASYEASLDTLIRMAEAPGKQGLRTEGVLRIQQLLARCGDTHTSLDYNYILAPDLWDELPLAVRWFADGYYVTSCQVESLVGGRLEAINGHPVSEISDSLLTLVSRDNEAVEHVQVERTLRNREILFYFGLLDESSREVIVVVRKNGRCIEDTIGKPYYPPRAADRLGQPADPNEPVYQAWVPSGPPPMLHQLSSPAWSLRVQHPVLWDTVVEAQRLCYVQYNRCDGREGAIRRRAYHDTSALPSFADAARKLRYYLQQPGYVCILDLRNNAGGDSRDGAALARELAALGDSIRGKLYVAIGNPTASSAVLVAIDLNRRAGAILIGAPTYGRPSHYGYIRKVRLRDSGILLIHSTHYFDRGTTAPTLRPAIAAELTLQDYMAGRDPVLEAASGTVR